MRGYGALARTPGVTDTLRFEICDDARARARTRPRRTQAVFVIRKRPSARRGPGIVSVDRNVRSNCRCSCVLQFTR